jgi:glycosyltransferase involved in cell wall biosynthesis
MKIAIVHDYLREYGGAERVLEALHELYPQAPIYVGFIDHRSLGMHAQRFSDWNIRQTWLCRLPFYKTLYSPYRLFAPKAFASLDLSAFDVVISSSNAYFAKSVRVPNGKHLCYCHTPPRALYGYSTMSNWKANPVTRVIGTIMNHFLRVVDFNAAQKVDVFIANSLETARRITKFYRRDSVVIHPPVKLVDQVLAEKRQLLSAKERGYFLYVNRLALAKHPEIAVRVCSSLQLPLKVVGEGKMLVGLQKMAGPTVEFLGGVSDEQLSELYAGAKALLYPVEDEDFGIVPIEAMAYGTPVIAHNSGGPKETVMAGKSGLLFDELSESGLEQAMKKFAKTSFVPKIVQDQSVRFSSVEFKAAIEKCVGQ